MKEIWKEIYSSAGLKSYLVALLFTLVFFLLTIFFIDLIDDENDQKKIAHVVSQYD